MIYFEEKRHNNLGFETSRTCYKSSRKNGKSILWKKKFKYDRNNKLTSEEHFELRKGVLTLISKFKYKYNKDGSLIHSSYYRLRKQKLVLVEFRDERL
jgi:hypothetical protein